jgi:hypothetical protein
MTVRDLAEKYSSDGSKPTISVVDETGTVCEFNAQYGDFIKDELMDREVSEYRIVTGLLQRTIVVAQLTESTDGEGGNENVRETSAENAN